MLDKLQQDLKQAQKDKQEMVVSTLRLLLSEIQYEKGKTGTDLTDDQIIGVIQRELKKRKEASASFTAGDRLELAQKEQDEAVILERYLPEQLSDQELSEIVENVIAEANATSLQRMGEVIGLVMNKVGKSADGGRVSALVKQKLT